MYQYTANPNFGRSVLGCIEADFCNFTKLTKGSFCCIFKFYKIGTLLHLSSFGIPTFASLHAQHLRTGRPKLRSYGAPVSYGGYGGATYGASYGGYGGASYARPATYSAAAPVGTVSPLPA